MENEHSEPQPQPLPSPWALPDDSPVRHDGWTGERMAKFCETLADTGIVADACLAAGKSIAGAYGARRRNPVFAAAWEAALTIARDRLADTLLARSIEGTAELFYKDGELVGERRVMDSRLGLAILRRLDLLAETGMPLGSRGPRLASPAARPPLDWDLALDALRTGESETVAAALAMLRGDKVEEVYDPPNSLVPALPVTFERDEWEADRVWQTEEGEWWTDFPPPPGFEGEQSGVWGDCDYQRRCSAEEQGLLDAGVAAQDETELAEQEEARRSFFARIEADLEADADQSGDLLAERPPSD